MIAPVLLRANLRSLLPEATLQMAGRPTQFGIDEKDIPDAIQLCQQLPHLHLHGFHLHSLSNNLDARRHLQLLQHYRQIVENWIKMFDLQITTLNIGGGIGVNFTDLDQQFDWQTFTDELSHIFPPAWHILFECGRFLTASCGYYAVEVLDIKANHEEIFVIIAGGTHHFRLPSSWHYSHPFQIIPVEAWPYPFERREVSEQKVTIAGQLCSPKDILASQIAVSKIRIGDVLIFPYTGAYAWSISHHDFLSHPHPEMFYLSEDLTQTECQTRI
jgi:diaminopimelate decarboxylase